MNLTTTTPALVHALARDQNWALVRANRTKSTMQKDFKRYGIKVGTDASKSDNRITYSFNWKK